MKSKATFQQLPIELLTRGRYQPRKHFDTTALEGLAESIKSSGIIEPIVVRPKEKQYEIIAGERRWRAAQLAGLATVPCLINEYTDEQAAAVTTIENIQRQDLNPIEEAQAYQRLVDDFKYRHEDVAMMIGKSRAAITNSLRLLQLDNRLQQWLIEGLLSEGHGKILAGLSSMEQYPLAQRCIQQSWSVRKLEQIMKQPELNTNNKKSSHLKHFEDNLGEQLCTEVKVEGDEENKKGGWLRIRYHNPEILEGLLDKMGLTYDKD